MSLKKGKDRSAAGLGRAIINRTARDVRATSQSHLYSREIDTNIRLQSITREKDIDNFINTAKLAGTDFAAEKKNLSVVNSPANTGQDGILPSQKEEDKLQNRHQMHKSRLCIPRRPFWTEGISSDVLDIKEREKFLEWRRGLAQLQEEEQLLLTPFERNLEVWRQLWRVVERSHLVVQIVDARNPLRFRCEDLELYVNEFQNTRHRKGMNFEEKRNMLLINKADLLTHDQRKAWAQFFEEKSIRFAFFSATNASTMRTGRGKGDELNFVSARRNQISHDTDEIFPDPEVTSAVLPPTISNDQSVVDSNLFLAVSNVNEQETRTKILDVSELIHLLENVAASSLRLYADMPTCERTLVIGLVGYPNVGKSSTINALLGEKKVNVSSTPGKTKHFQTFHLSPDILICDCPGLVFPQFSATSAELICDGILPIDHIRDYISPVSLVTRRIPKKILELYYGLTIEADSLNNVTAENLLYAYAVSRGFMRSGQGSSPDEARAARHILKDYVNARLVYCHPPLEVSEGSFNSSTMELALQKLLEKKQISAARLMEDYNGDEGKEQPVSSIYFDEEFFKATSTSRSRTHIRDSRLTKYVNHNYKDIPEDDLPELDRLASKRYFKSKKKLAQHPAGL